MRHRAKRALFVIAACVVVAGIGELLARMFVAPPQRVFIRESAPLKRYRQQAATERRQLHLPSRSEQGLYIITATGRRLIPNADATIKRHELSGQQVRIRTNSLGYRNPDLGEKQGKRVLFLGDSITLGDHIAEEETFVRRVEARFKQQGKAVQTINAAAGRGSLRSELAVLVETGLSTKPDVVVVGFYLDDFEESSGVSIRPVRPWLERSRLLCAIWRALGLLEPDDRGSDLVPQEQEKQKLAAWAKAYEREHPPAEGDFREKPAAFHRMVLKWFDLWGAAFSPRAWEEMEPVFAELKRLSGLHRFELMIVALPVRHQVDAKQVHDYPQRRLKQIGQRLKIDVLDLLPVLRKASRAFGEGTERLYVDQRHYTTHAHGLIAEHIVEFMEK